MRYQAKRIHQLTILIPVLGVTTILYGCTTQQPDPDFDASVLRPAYVIHHPKVLIDEAHNNIHRAGGTYKPFADLIGNDGYSIETNQQRFSIEVLAGVDILAIVNAKGKERKHDPAFADAECDAVEAWVHNGGSLLLIADHYPLGSAADGLSRRFGVRMSNGFVSDSLHCDSTAVDHSQLVFSRQNGLLGDHPILLGRDSTERINRIVTFTGQSLTASGDITPLLVLSPAATEDIPDSIWEEKEWVFLTNTLARFNTGLSAAGRAQGVATEFGKGRVVIMAEAAMFTAQVFEKERFGMQVPGIDNRQFVLNTMHWLTRLF